MRKIRPDEIDNQDVNEEFAEEAKGCQVCGGKLHSTRPGYAGCKKCGQDYLTEDNKLVRIKITFMSATNIEYVVE